MGIRKKKIEIGPDTVLQRRNDLLFNEIDGEVVMLSIENGEYYGINQVGSRIWDLLERPISFRELVSNLLIEFNISEEKCKIDTLMFVRTLIEKKLIKF